MQVRRLFSIVIFGVTFVIAQTGFARWMPPVATKSVRPNGVSAVRPDNGQLDRQAAQAMRRWQSETATRYAAATANDAPQADGGTRWQSVRQIADRHAERLQRTVSLNAVSSQPMTAGGTPSSLEKWVRGRMATRLLWPGCLAAIATWIVAAAGLGSSIPGTRISQRRSGSTTRHATTDRRAWDRSSAKTVATDDDGNLTLHPPMGSNDQDKADATAVEHGVLLLQWPDDYFIRPRSNRGKRTAHRRGSRGRSAA